MAERTVTTIAIAAAFVFGILPFAQLFRNHPFEGGRSDVVTWAQHAEQTLAARAVEARGTHGFYTAVQLFPFLPLETAAMTLVDARPPVLNLWVLQHVVTLLNTAAFFLLGRRVSGTTAGGAIAALASVVFLDIPIWHNAGLARYLSGFQYSSTFFAILLSILPDLRASRAPWRTRVLVFTLGAAAFFSHHHFGILRIGIAVGAIVVLVLLSHRRAPAATHTVLLPSLQALLAVIVVWIAANVPYLPNFLRDFGPAALYGRIF